MDYDKVSQSITTLLKTAVPEGGTTSSYDKIPAVDEQRELIVSHIKSTYTSDTGEMINGKEFVDTANTYKNMLKSAEGQLETIETRTSQLESEISKKRDSIERSKHINNILKILFVTIVLVIVNYVIGSAWVHGIAFVILLIGFGIALYTRGEISIIDFSGIKQWIYTTLGR